MGADSDGMSCEFGMRQSVEEGVMDPGGGGTEEGLVVPPPVGDCLSRTFIWRRLIVDQQEPWRKGKGCIDCTLDHDTCNQEDGRRR